MTTSDDLQRIILRGREAARDIGQQAQDALVRFQTSQVARELRRSSAQLIKDLAPIIAAGLQELDEARKQGLVSNWDRLSVPEIFETLDLIRETGWSLVWVPDAEVIQAILGAKTEAQRRELLLGAEPRIIDGLQRVLDQTEHADVERLRVAAAEALETYKSGHLLAAQALAASILGEIVHDHFDHGTWSEARAKVLALDPEEQGIRRLRFSALQLAVACALDPVSHPGDPVTPHRFHRHASAHGVDPSQYTPINSLSSVMLVVSLTHELGNLADYS